MRDPSTWPRVYEFEQETDGRWICEAVSAGGKLNCNGILAYGATQEEAEANVDKLIDAVAAESQS